MAYALLIYKLVSRIKSRARYLIPPFSALILATIASILLETEIVKDLTYAALFGYFFMFVFITEMTMGMITPVFAFERRTTEKQRSLMILLFSLVLALLFMKGFAEVMGTPTSKTDLLRLIDYRDVLKLGNVAFHLISSLLLYFEILILSSTFYILCYGLVVAFKGVKNEAGS